MKLDSQPGLRAVSETIAIKRFPNVDTGFPLSCVSQDKPNETIENQSILIQGHFANLLVSGGCG